MNPPPQPADLQVRYDELNTQWPGLRTASFRRHGCIGQFVVGLVLSH